MGFSTRTMTAEDWGELAFFRASEFTHPDKMGYEFMLWLDALRAKANVPITVTSGHRSPSHNRRVKGASNSAHVDVPCDAVDIGERLRPDDPNWNYTRWQIITTAIAMGCQRIGMYANGSLHLDMTHDVRPAPRLWRVVR